MVQEDPAAALPSTPPLLSVVVPTYNEIATIDPILAAIDAVEVDKELILVDDCSTDGTRERIAEFARAHPRVRVVYQPRNQGKGAALRAGFAAATGQYVVIQDADLEYDPAEYPKLLKPLLDGRADVVYGSRYLNGGADRRVLYFWHTTGNRFLTLLSNMFSNLKLTDMETCYKVFSRRIIQSIPLQEAGFGIEPEITAKLADYRLDGRPLRIYEVAVSYRGRSYSEGKKMAWRDALEALWCIVKYNLLR